MNLLTNIRTALRSLLCSPGFTSAAVLMLALCIAANVVIFAVTDAILLRSLPYAQPDRLVIAQHAYPGAGIERDFCSLPNYYDWRTLIPAFTSTCASRSINVIVGDRSTPERVCSETVSSEFFDTLGVKPALGRFFTEEETNEGRSAVVILTDAYWRSHFNADPGILGRELRVDGKACQIVGVLRPDFRYLSSPARLYFPLVSALRERGADQRHSLDVQIIARLASGFTLASAQAQIDAFNTRQLADDPFAEQLKGTEFRTPLFALHADHVRTVRPVILLLQLGAMLLLVIGAVNLINLLLVRANGRAKEFGVRQALGASRRQIAGTVVIETILLAGIGGLVGIGFGAVGISLLPALGLSNLPLGSQIAFNSRIVISAIGGSILTGIVFAIPVTGFHMHHHLAPVLASSSYGCTTGRVAERLRRAFVIGQIALAFMLLTSAGLLTFSLQRVLQISPGFQPQQALSARIGLPPDRYRDGMARLAFIERFLDTVHADPGVSHAASSNVIPFTGQDNSTVITVEGVAPRPEDPIRTHFKSEICGDFWQTLGIPLRQGRFLVASDSRSPQRVCVIDEAFAKRYWPKGDALGHRISRSATFDEKEAFTIVGIVGHVKQGKLVETALGTAYLPYQFQTQGDLYVIVRSRMTSALAANALRKTISRLDPEIPVDDLKTMQERIDATMTQHRYPALMAGVFAVIALLLSAIGTYGVVAQTIAQSRREIGIHMAIGALPRQIGRHYLSLGLRMILIGSALGVFGAWILGRTMQSVLFNVPAFHFATFIGSTLVMVLVSLISCWIPAWRASRLDPAMVIRSE